MSSTTTTNTLREIIDAALVMEVKNSRVARSVDDMDHLLYRGRAEAYQTVLNLLDKHDGVSHD